MAPDRCPECGRPRLAWDEAHGEVVCQVCGFVVQTARSRPGEATPSPGNTGAVTVDDQTSPDRDLPSQLSGSERRLIHVRQETRRLADALDCPADVAERAGDFVEQARERGITQGRPLEAVAAASLMSACRMLHLVRTEARIEEAAKADWTEIKAAYKAIVRGLDLPIPPMTAHEYMGQLASDLDVPGPLEAQARDLLQEVCGTEEAAGKDPLGWAAAALVHVCRAEEEDLSMNQAAQAAGVSPSTVKARLEDLDDVDET